MKLAISVMLLLFLSGCTVYERHIYLTVEGESSLYIGSVETLAEVTKGDENQTAAPDISPTIKVPLMP